MESRADEINFYRVTVSRSPRYRSYTDFAINNRCLRFAERMLTFDESRYVPPPAADLFIPQRCLLVIFTDKTSFFRCLFN